jgi:hypothetical protein
MIIRRAIYSAEDFYVHRDQTATCYPPLHVNYSAAVPQQLSHTNKHIQPFSACVIQVHDKA